MKTDNSALGRCEGFMAAYGGPALTVDLISDLSSEILARRCPNIHRGQNILRMVSTGGITVVERTGNGPTCDFDFDSGDGPEYTWNDVDADRKRSRGKASKSQFDEWGRRKGTTGSMPI